MSTTTFDFDLSPAVKTYLTTLPDCAISAMRQLSFDVPISNDIFHREDCRIVVVIDRDDKLNPWKATWVFREDPGNYQGKLKGRYELAEELHSACWLLLHAMDVDGMSKERLIELVDVLEWAARVRGTEKRKVWTQTEVAFGKYLLCGVVVDGMVVE